MSIAVLMDYCYLEEKLMNILNLSHYYFPEKISSSHLTEDLEDAYIKAGHTITVFAPTPTRGISDDIRRSYKNKLYEERKSGAIKIHRFHMMREGKNPIGRAFRYFCVHWKHYKVAIKQTNIDVIIAGSTPPTQGLVCAIVAKKLSKKYKKKIPFIYNLQDIFPDSLVNIGMTKRGSLIWKIGRKMEDYIYKNADRIVVISEDIKRNIMEKGVSEEKVQLTYNWINTQEVHPILPENNWLLNELGLNPKNFYVVYAGNLGKAQGIDVILEAAELLKSHVSIQFLIFGNGVEEESIRTIMKQKHLSNVQLYPLQPVERVSEVYSLGDICVVACKKGNGVNAFPSKTVSIMATATPVLASFDRESELCRLIENYQCGVCCEPEDARVMADTILQLFEDSVAVIKMGQNARRLVETRFGKATCVAEYVNLFKELTAKSQ